MSGHTEDKPKDCRYCYFWKQTEGCTYRGKTDCYYVSAQKPPAAVSERKRQGLGKPNLIYVKNFVSAPESKFKNGENQNSGLLKIETQEFPKSKGSNTEKNNTDFNDTESLPFPSFRGGQKWESKGNDAERRAQYRELIMENISYDVLLVDLPYDKEIVEEILELIVDTVCTTKETVRISDDDKPAEVVRSRFLKLDSEHIRFVVSCMKENTTKIKNIRQYLLATLYNASLTMTSYYAALVQHDMAEGRI